MGYESTGLLVKREKADGQIEKVESLEDGSTMRTFCSHNGALKLDHLEYTMAALSKRL